MSDLPMWNDDSSPFRSRNLDIRRQTEQYGISKHLPSQPRPRTQRQSIRDLRNKQMRDLRAQGWLIKQIAYRFKVNIVTVSRICRGVKPVR